MKIEKRQILKILFGLSIMLESNQAQALLPTIDAGAIAEGVSSNIQKVMQTKVIVDATNLAGEMNATIGSAKASISQLGIEEAQKAAEKIKKEKENLEEAKKKYDEYKKEIEEKKKAIEEAKAEVEKYKNEATSVINDAKSMANEATSVINDAKSMANEATSAINEAKSMANEATSAINDAKSQVQSGMNTAKSTIQSNIGQQDNTTINHDTSTPQGTIESQNPVDSASNNNYGSILQNSSGYSVNNRNQIGQNSIGNQNFSNTKEISGIEQNVMQSATASSNLNKNSRDEEVKTENKGQISDEGTESQSEQVIEEGQSAAKDTIDEKEEVALGNAVGTMNNQSRANEEATSTSDIETLATTKSLKSGENKTTDLQDLMSKAVSSSKTQGSTSPMTNAVQENESLKSNSINKEADKTQVNIKNGTTINSKTTKGFRKRPSVNVNEGFFEKQSVDNKNIKIYAASRSHTEILLFAQASEGDSLLNSPTGKNAQTDEFIFSDKLALYCNINVNDLDDEDKMKECLKNLIRYRSDSNSQVAAEGNSLYTEIMQDTAAAQAAESMKEKNERTNYTEEVLNPMQQDLAASDSIRNDINSVAQSSNQTQILLNGIIKTYTSQLTSEALENLGKYNAKYVDTTEEGQ